MVMSSQGNRRAVLCGLAGTSFSFLTGGCTADGGVDWNAANQALEGAAATGGGGNALAEAEIAKGLREALKVGTSRVVDTLGKVDGFNADPKVRIPLPPALTRAQSSLRLIGASGLIDDLDLRINRAAEQATPIAKDVFVEAITQLTFDDVQEIYQGADDAATRYLDRTTRTSLNTAMRPIVDDALSKAGAVSAYDALVAEAAAAPFLPEFTADLTNHALDGAMDGLFFYLASEEKAIRENPAKRTSEILKRVFGANR